MGRTGRRRWGPAGGRDDEGMVTTALVVLGCFLLLVLTLLAVRPMVAATDQSSRAQTAADAAALGAAEEIRKDLLVEVAAGYAAEGDLFDLLSSQLGRSGAEDFAGRNGADLLDYDYDWVDDEIYVLVRSRDALEGGERSEAEATASLGLGLGACSWRPRPTPSVPPAAPTPPPGPPAPPSPTPPPAPSPPPDLDLVLRCPGTDLSFELIGSSGLIVLRPPDQLQDLLETRLTE